ncbi:uncharacterized protein LOC121383034 [Gigantopelta aegis]|uniref:uncharacterized protein LOC121383034 n=1 Tax=Gigantopelta aegis TaxID=1735272 RepID=UPI001B8879D5|nr:uncharacterized protein LOC121383034 [Gigantopelta aegis]
MENNSTTRPHDSENGSPISYSDPPPTYEELCTVYAVTNPHTLFHPPSYNEVVYGKYGINPCSAVVNSDNNTNSRQTPSADRPNRPGVRDCLQVPENRPRTTTINRTKICILVTVGLSVLGIIILIVTLTMGNYNLDDYVIEDFYHKQGKVASCLNSTDCWVKYNFLFEDNWNDCHGDQYVKKTTYKVGKYVGVILCSPNRYKLFLSDSLTDRFLNIGDRKGSGEDHCEFIGSRKNAISIDNNFWHSPGTIGYIRSRRGKTPSKGRIGGGTGATWTGNYYGKWIECGVSIPGNSRVVTGPGAQERTTEPPIEEPMPKPANRCIGSYCPGSYETGAKCVHGYCVCSLPGYNYLTCLPEHDGCSIERNKEPRAVPSFRGERRSSVYSCINEDSLTLSPEVHVLSCYENINRRPPRAAVTVVDIQGNTSRPVVLVLSTYEPVAWRINVPVGLTIQKIQIITYYVAQSSVTVVNSGSKPPVEKSSDISSGYGSDDGGGQTLKMLKEVKSLFGHVTSFSGTYKVDHWSLKVGS